MQCERPIDVSVKTGGDLIKVSKNGRLFPSVGRASFLVPCGKCFACLSRKKSQAVFRMDCERRFGHLEKCEDGSVKVRRYKHCFFVSLSYATEFLPYSWEFVDRRTGEYFKPLESEEPILCPHHVTDFMKRFRRYYGKDSVKVFMCGEYGDQFDRPHYHFIWYTDMDWNSTREAIRHAWSCECPKNRVGEPGTFEVVGKYKTYRLSFGRIDVKSVNIRRMRYVAKYVVKDNNSNSLVPKFARVSHGLGSAFLESEQACMVRKSKSLYAFTVDGKKCSLGRYYLHRLFTKSELRSLVDLFVASDLAPVELDNESAQVREVWYREHIASKTALYRVWKANQKNPLLVYL